jgi:cardiolipin synthase (CMP-forming)
MLIENTIRQDDLTSQLTQRVQILITKAMLLRSRRVWLVESISLFRLVAALLFAFIAFKNMPIAVVAGLYVLAMATDVIDGYAARKLNVETYFGKVLDLVGDKSLTGVSLLYAAGCGINVFPLAMIAIREIIMLGARMIIVEGTQLFPTNRILGGMMWLLLWGNTLFLVLARRDNNLINIANNIYWICALIFFLNFAARIYVSWSRIKASLTNGDDHSSST